MADEDPLNWPVCPLPTPSASSSATRSRRMQKSSEEEDKTQPVRRFGISNVKFRVGAPPLRPLPLETSFHPTGVQIVDDLRDDLINEAKRVVSKYQICDMDFDDIDDEPTISLVTRSVPGAPQTAHPTIFVIAEWTEASRDTWESAVKEIKRFANELVSQLGSPDVDISVEIIAPELTDRKYLGPVVGNPLLEAAWPNLRSQVLNQLESFSSTRSHMTALSLFRLGYSEDTSSNPITVYISMDNESDETGWPPVIESINERLRVLGWKDLCVHIEHNVMKELAFELVAPSAIPRQRHQGYNPNDLLIKGDYQQKTNMGADICASRYFDRDDGKRSNPLLGTLGCYIELKSTTNPTWARYALTNHHVIRPCFDGFSVKKGKNDETVPVDPGMQSDLRKVDKKGFFPKAEKNATSLESPSRMKHNRTLHTLEGQIITLGQHAVGECAKLKLEKDAKAAFFDQGSHHLGFPYASSGHLRSTCSNGRLDWALIKVEENREGKNILLSGQDWLAKYPTERYIPAPESSTFGALLKPQGEITFKTMSSGTPVYKQGAITGATAGTFSNFKTDCVIRGDKYLRAETSSEYVCIGCVGDNSVRQEFALIGDSGSVVFDGKGRAVGLLFRGQMPQQNKEGYALVTPIEDVLEDIKAFSKGVITDIRIAEDVEDDVEMSG